jgi:hypothetical protein
MIVANQAELMLMAQPGFHALNGLAGLASLGCGDDSSCGCGCNKGMGDITDRSDTGMFFCNWTPLRFTPACSVPTVADIINSPSDCGGSMTSENCQGAARQAAIIVAADKSSNPCAYSELSDASWWDYISCNLKDSQNNNVKNWLLIGGLGLGALLLLRR